ncbi:hypothetical protein B9Z55_026913 [Caenorhabditis nigoni]|uniref:F-box domain-containing protein n=1 Tax=Caenorhabditis nigoni TaxID=1611254 RepID=A0A2G5SID5_9PELO|nr:hypothetical protein B9Z55_026913 [Caenorhabditis nigoni]
MDKSSAVVNTNDHYLKTCILNEVLKKTPIFDSYETFCGKVGQNAMLYPDFEFWYYRFYHRKMDFDYDRSLDPVPKTIMDMPVKLMYKITENLDPVDRAYLRSMNKSIKDIADSHAPIFDKIDITVFGGGLYWELNDKRFHYVRKDDGYILFTPHEDIERFIKKGLEYLTSLFKIPRIQVNHLSISLYYPTQVLNDILPLPFHAKSVKLYASDMNQIFPFFSALDPGELESTNSRVSYSGDRDQLLRFFATEQFKQARTVQLKGYLDENDLVKFSHLKSFKCELTRFDQVDFRRVREIISTFKQFESCEIERVNRRDMFQIRTIGQALGAEIPFGPLKIITHRYQIPGSNEFLEFKIEDESYYCTIKIVKVR